MVEGMGIPAPSLEPLAVGIAAPGCVVESVSADIREILGITPEELIGRSIADDTRPNHSGALLSAISQRAVGDMLLCEVYLRNRDGASVPVRILVIRLDEQVPPRVAFAVLRRTAGAEPKSSDRLAELEIRLQRIAGEVRAAGLLADIDHHLPSAADHPELNQLSARQWQILTRLLRGDRVPTIAGALHLGQSTVRNYLSAIFARFDVHSQAELLTLLRSGRPK
jgi:PAS domain S-box-containing protein